MEEKKFPIYEIYGRWNQDNYQNNSSGYNKMFRSTPSNDELDECLKDFKKKTEEKHKNVQWLDFGIKFRGEETWMLRWFCHLTYNQFESDEDAKNSFREFVERKKKENVDNGHFPTDYCEHTSKPYCCLMGAQDEWRWNVCHCDDCKQAGHLIITH